MPRKDYPTDTLMYLKSEGLCSGSDTDLFFQTDEDSVMRAKAICYGCHVIDACREYAIFFEEFGVWGGLSETERRAVKRTYTGQGALL